MKFSDYDSVYMQASLDKNDIRTFSGEPSARAKVQETAEHSLKKKNEKRELFGPRSELHGPKNILTKWACDLSNLGGAFLPVKISIERQKEFLPIDRLGKDQTSSLSFHGVDCGVLSIPTLFLYLLRSSAERASGETPMDDEPLDFEREDPLLRPSPVPSKKRKRVIGLDDLLADHYKEERKRTEKEAKARSKGKKKYDSDEDENGREALLSKLVNKCKNQMDEIKTDEEAPEWGLQAFVDQKPMPAIVPPELINSSLLQPFMNNRLNSLVGLTPETGFSFLEGLLLNGWLSRLICKHVLIDKAIESWTFNLMLYSSNEELASSACEFWCTLLSFGNKIGSLPQMGWASSYSELKKALQIYGFHFSFSSSVVAEDTGSIAVRPPQNVRFWFKVIAACCGMRKRNSVFSTSEAEELLEIVILLSLDRQLQGLSPLLYNSMQSLISYFGDEEWSTSCTKVSKSIACRVPKDTNCLQTVKLISGLDSRSKNLQSSVAFHILANCLDNKDSDDLGLLNLLLSIDLKQKSINFFKIYMYLVLAQNWLLNSTLLEGKSVIREMWCLYLRRCSCQISGTDLRSYASKVRNKASFLLQDTGNK